MIDAQIIGLPKKGDRFFLSSGVPSEIALLHNSFQKLDTYADGYQICAIQLMDLALNCDSNRDFSVYPITFLIRHYLELRIKGLIQGINYITQKQDFFPQHHSLKDLWFDDFKTGYKKLGENMDSDPLKAVDNLILEMDTIDPLSFSFRYPTNKLGKKTQKLQYISLSNLRRTFLSVSHFLDGISSQIDNSIDMSAELTP